jgi:hypothetical protein
MTYFEQIPVAVVKNLLVKNLLRSNVARPPTGPIRRVPTCQNALATTNQAKAATSSQKRAMLVRFSGSM